MLVWMGGLLEHAWAAAAAEADAAAAAAEAVTTIATAAAAANDDVPPGDLGDSLVGLVWVAGLSLVMVVVIEGKGGGLILFG